MLETLRIQNLAVIDETEISFRPGLNILSGETGAGKSIVISAISLLLGGRASSDLIRKECDEAVVEGLFNISKLQWIKDRLKRLGFDSDVNELLVKRIVSQSGRNRVYVSGELATVSILQDLCDGLIDLCGQHEHQSLIKPSVQLELLDQYGQTEAKVERVSELFVKVKSLHSEKTSIQSDEEGRVKKLDFLRFQIRELEDAGLKRGEDGELTAEKKLLQSTELRMQTAEQVRQLLESGGSMETSGGLLDQLRSAVARLKTLKELDETASSIGEGLERALSEIEEVDLNLNRYLSSIDLNPQRLGEVQARLSLIASLRRKYGDSVEEMMRTFARLRKELSQMESASERLVEIQEEIEEAEAVLFKEGKLLSGKRRSTARVISESVTQELQDLKMEGSHFRAVLTSVDDLSRWTQRGGADQVEFRIKSNQGEDEKSLGKVASGGELSRVMLAIRRTISDRGRIGVYLFDEIDAGMGGQTAFEVGKKLHSVARHNQVICITHLPQVASFADHHLSVRKRLKNKRTVTQVIELNQKGCREEIARMLGGDRVTPAGLKNAAELLDRAAV